MPPLCSLTSAIAQSDAGWSRAQYLTLLHLYVFEALLPERRDVAGALAAECGVQGMFASGVQRRCSSAGVETACCLQLLCHMLSHCPGLQRDARCAITLVCLQGWCAGCRPLSCPLKQTSGSFCWTSWQLSRQHSRLSRLSRQRSRRPMQRPPRGAAS